MPFEQNRNGEFFVIGGPFQYGEPMGVTGFAFDHQMGVQRRGAGQFGRNRPIGITDRYEGATGTIEIEGTEAAKTLMAHISRTLEASFINHPANRLYPFYLVVNVYDDDETTPLRSYFVYLAKLSGAPVNVAGDTLRYTFEAVIALEFHGKVLQIDVEDGAATPVTAMNFAAEAAQVKNIDNAARYAVLVLKQTSNTSKVVTELAHTTDYTETSSGITLVSGLAAGERALTVSVAA